jgi:hypothetical protein
VTFAGCHGERRKERRKDGARGGASALEEADRIAVSQVLGFMANLSLTRLVAELLSVADSSLPVLFLRCCSFGMRESRMTDIAYQDPSSHARSVVSRYCKVRPSQWYM